MHDLIEELVRHYKDLRKQLTRVLRDPEHAADIAQSSFERVYTHALSHQLSIDFKLRWRKLACTLPE